MDQYAKSFTKPSIRIGTITVLLAMLGSFFPNIYLYLAHGVWPDASHMFSAWGSVVMAFGAFYLVEPISYFPVFGPTGNLHRHPLRQYLSDPSARGFHRAGCSGCRALLP